MIRNGETKRGDKEGKTKNQSRGTGILQKQPNEPKRVGLADERNEEWGEKDWSGIGWRSRRVNC
jgi:hypothetical protein